MMSIDDDSAPMSVEGLSGVIEKMDSNLAVGVVGFPILLKSGAIAQSGRGDWPESSTYVGCGHIIRVSTFRELGGYWGDLVYWGEERDYSLRLLAAGHKVLESCKPVIFHRVSSNGRSSSRLCYLRARNTLLIWYHRVPLVLLPFVITRAILGILSSYVRERDLLIASLRGMADAFRAVLKGKTGTKSSSRLSLRQWFYWRKLI
jgi:GT2 family glycosyltransferase